MSDKKNMYLINWYKAQDLSEESALLILYENMILTQKARVCVKYNHWPLSFNCSQCPNCDHGHVTETTTVTWFCCFTRLKWDAIHYPKNWCANHWLFQEIPWTSTHVSTGVRLQRCKTSAHKMSVCTCSFQVNNIFQLAPKQQLTSQAKMVTCFLIYSSFDLHSAWVKVWFRHENGFVEIKERSKFAWFKVGNLCLWSKEKGISDTYHNHG